MKFRVETWDTTERCGDWVCVLETGEADLARVDFAWWVKFSEPHVCIRLREYRNRWSGWQFVVNKYGTMETKPMASRVVYDCGCASCGEDWYPCCEAHGQKHERTKPMSTKQRGDVEKSTVPTESERFLIHTGQCGVKIHFTRDEFRRIWEAGNAEFLAEGAHMPCYWSEAYYKMEVEKGAEIEQLRRNVNNQVAEIARLKAEVKRGDSGSYQEILSRLNFTEKRLIEKDTQLADAQSAIYYLRKEKDRLRAWLQHMADRNVHRGDITEPCGNIIGESQAALRGEEAPHRR